MPTPIVYEMHNSRSFTIDDKAATLPRMFFIQHTDNEVEVQELALGAATPVYLGLVRKRLEVENLGGGCWIATWEYGVSEFATEPGSNPGGEGAPGSEEVPAPTDAENLGPSMSFDTSGGTSRITQSRETLEQSAGAPDTKQAIGLTRDGIAGCDITVPALQWSRQVPRRNVKLPYLRTIMNLVGKVNTLPFYGFEARSVLYLGASGQSGAGGLWQITHKFAVSENEVLINIGNGLTVTAKGGWDYLWVGYREAENGNILLQQPAWYNVERVYLSGNFNLLEIGA